MPLLISRGTPYSLLAIRRIPYRETGCNPRRVRPRRKGIRADTGSGFPAPAPSGQGMQQASQRLFALVTVVFVALAAFLAARIVSQTIAYRIHTDEGAVPPAPAPVRRVEEPSRGADLRAIQDRNLFNTKPAPPAPAVPDTPPPAAPVTAPEPPAALPITLVATACAPGGRPSRRWKRGARRVSIGSASRSSRAPFSRRSAPTGSSSHRHQPPGVSPLRQPPGRRPVGQPRGPPSRAGPECARHARAHLPVSPKGTPSARSADTSWWWTGARVEQATANLSQLITQIPAASRNMGPDNQADGFKVFPMPGFASFARIGASQRRHPEGSQWHPSDGSRSGLLA